MHTPPVVRLANHYLLGNDLAKSVAVSLLMDAPELSLDELIALVDESDTLNVPDTWEDVPAKLVHEALEKMRPRPHAGGMKVYHATDPAKARTLLRRGLIPEGKVPFHGTDYAPGRGIDPGLYVGATAQAVDGYGRVTLEVTVPEEMLYVSTEQSQLGETDPKRSLRTHDGAVIHGRLPPESFRVVEGGHYL